MRKPKVILNFPRFSVADKIAFYRNILAKMTGNAAYPTPDITLASVLVLVDNLQLAYVAAQDGSRTAVSAMHDKELLADAGFRKLAIYVDRTADGDETKILSSGFHISKQPIASVKPVLNATDGSNTGSVKLIRKAVEGAKSYIWQYAKEQLPEAENDWTSGGFSTRASTEITDLDIAAKYWFRVAAVTKDGTTDFCNPLFYIVS